MPCTALKFQTTEGEVKRLKFMTVQTPEHLDVDIFSCNEDFIPEGDAFMTIDKRDEENYHRTLRREATEKGHYVSEESTNPEWNPDYIERINNEEGD